MCSWLYIHCLAIGDCAPEYFYLGNPESDAGFATDAGDRFTPTLKIKIKIDFHLSGQVILNRNVYTDDHSL